MDSYDDRNYRVRKEGAGCSTWFVFKAHNGFDSRKPEFIIAQIEALKKLSENNIGCPVDVAEMRQIQVNDDVESDRKQYQARVDEIPPWKVAI